MLGNKDKSKKRSLNKSKQQSKKRNTKTRQRKRKASKKTRKNKIIRFRPKRQHYKKILELYWSPFLNINIDQASNCRGLSRAVIQYCFVLIFPIRAIDLRAQAHLGISFGSCAMVQSPTQIYSSTFSEPYSIAEDITVDVLVRLYLRLSDDLGEAPGQRRSQNTTFYCRQLFAECKRKLRL